MEFYTLYVLNWQYQGQIPLLIHRIIHRMLAISLLTLYIIAYRIIMNKTQNV